MKDWTSLTILTLAVLPLTIALVVAELIAPSTAAATAAVEVTLTDPMPEPVVASDTQMPVIDVSTLPEPEIGVYAEELPAQEPAIDIDLMARCIEAEAGTEDLDGKRLVADCILNMVDAPEYPDNVTDVIMRPGTFSVVSNGMIWKVTPSEETYRAIQMELENRISYEIMYFRTGRYHSFGTPWGKWGAHYFSTR